MNVRILSDLHLEFGESLLTDNDYGQILSFSIDSIQAGMVYLENISGYNYSKKR